LRRGRETPRISAARAHADDVLLLRLVEAREVGRRLGGHGGYRQVLRPDNVAGGEDDGPGKAVLQLAHVARPAVAHQRVHRFP
jgi:hypothetical protein